MAFSFCSLFTTLGFVNFWRLRNSFTTPVFSNFLFSFFSALSMVSPSFTGTTIINNTSFFFRVNVNFLIRGKNTFFFNTCDLLTKNFKSKKNRKHAVGFQYNFHKFAFFLQNLPLLLRPYLSFIYIKSIL